MTYGERFRLLRERSGRTTGQIAKDLDLAYANSVYGIERTWRVPALDTLVRHAQALNADPWELLMGVETEFDLMRQLSDVRNKIEARRQADELLKRFEATKRSPKTRRAKARAPSERLAARG